MKNYWIKQFLLCLTLCALSAFCGDTLTYSLADYIADVLEKNQELHEKQFSREQATAMTWSKIRSKPYRADVSVSDKLSNQLSTNVLDKVPIVRENTSQVAGTVSKTFTTGTEVGVSYGYSYEKSNSEIVPEDLRSYHNANVNISVTQPLLSGLSNIVKRRDIVLANIEEKMSSLEYSKAVSATILKAVNVYYALMADQNQVLLKEISLEFANQQLSTMKTLVKKKFENTEKLLQYKAKVLERENESYAVQTSLEQQHSTFLQLIDCMQNNQVVQLTTLPLEPAIVDRGQLDALLDSSRAHRIDYLLALQNLAKAQLNLQMTESATLPDLSLKGTYFVYGTDPDFGKTFGKISASAYNDFKIGMTFSMPIDKEYRSSRLMPLKIALNESEFRTKSLERTIRQELQSAIAKIELNARQYASTKNAVAVADLNCTESQKLFEKGFMRFDDFLDQLKNKEISENQKLKTQIEYTKSFYVLRQSQGLLLESFKVEKR